MSRHGPGLRAASVACLSAAYLMVVLGSTVRITNSGMGCSSWPLCNGHLGLSGTEHAVLEQSHRYLAVVVTVLVVAIFGLAWRRARKDRLVYSAAASAVILIVVQVLLGAITVWLKNAGWTVALHLAGAWLLVAAVTVTAVAVWRVPAEYGADSSSVRVAPAGRVGVIAAASLFCLAASGMLVLDAGASNACRGWPVCGGGSGSATLVALQYLHRSFGVVATVAIGWTALRVLRAARTDLTGRALAGSALVLLAVTAGLGALVATTGAPAAEQDFHLAVATALWVTVVALATPGWAAAPPAAPAGAAPVSATGSGRI